MKEEGKSLLSHQLEILTARSGGKYLMSWAGGPNSWPQFSYGLCTLFRSSLHASKGTKFQDPPLACLGVLLNRMGEGKNGNYLELEKRDTSHNRTSYLSYGFLTIFLSVVEL